MTEHKMKLGKPMRTTDPGDNRAYKAEDAGGNQWPMATVFVRRNGRIHRFWSSELFFTPPGRGPRAAARRLYVADVRDARSDASGRGDFEPSLCRRVSGLASL
jgi:hypothetical protein